MAVIRFSRRACAALLLLMAVSTQAQVTDRLFYSGFEKTNTQVFAGVVQQAPYFGSLDSYGLPNGRSDAMSKPPNAQLITDRVCNATGLVAQLNSTEPTYTTTSLLMNVNGVDTSLACTMSNAVPTCFDTFHVVGIGPRDVVTLVVTPHIPSRPITNDDSSVKVSVRFGWVCKEL